MECRWGEGGQQAAARDCRPISLGEEGKIHVCSHVMQLKTVILAVFSQPHQSVSLALSLHICSRCQ